MASKSELAISVSFRAISLEYELFVGVAAVGELVAIIAIVVIVASAFVASHIVASCIVAASVGIVDQPQQDVGGGSAVEQLVEVVAGGALDIVAVVDHLTVAVEAFVKGKVLQPRFCRHFYRRHFLRHHVYRLRCWWCNTTWDLFRNGVVLEKKENV